jgi:hypothetical protein
MLTIFNEIEGFFEDSRERYIFVCSLFTKRPDSRAPKDLHIPVVDEWFKTKDIAKHNFFSSIRTWNLPVGIFPI